MFDIGFSELLLILVIGLLVLGPTRLPLAIRTVMGWIKAVRNLAENVQNELSHELKLQELKEDIKKTEEAVNLQNFSPELSQTVNELKASTQQLKTELDTGIQDSKIDLDKVMNDEVSAKHEVKNEPSSSKDNTTEELDAIPVATNENLELENEDIEKQDAHKSDDDEKPREISLNPDYYPCDDEFAEFDNEPSDIETTNPAKQATPSSEHLVSNISNTNDLVAKEKESSR